MEIAAITDWLEQHNTTVDLLKWTAILVVAWIAGAFSFIRGLTRKPKTALITNASRCLVEEFDELNGKRMVMRAAFLLNAEVTNPSNENVTVKGFKLSYRHNRFWFPQSKELFSLSLPARPRQEMGSAIKVSKVFFSTFGDGYNDLTMTGVLSPKDFQSAYLLFVSFTWGSWNPRIRNGRVRVRLSAEITTGETLRSVAEIAVTQDKEQFEKWVPGIIDQINHQSTWNAFAD